MGGPVPGMSERDAEFWAGRMFDQAVATEKHRLFIESLGHPPVMISGRTAAEKETETEPEIREEPWREVEDGLPTPLRTMQKKAGAVGYSTRALLRRGARRDIRGKLKDPPEGEFALLVAARGPERFTAMWGESGGKWTFLEGLDYTPRDGVIPRIVKSTHIKKERLT